MVFCSTKQHLKVLLQLCLQMAGKYDAWHMMATILVIWEYQTAMVLLCVCTLEFKNRLAMLGPSPGVSHECHPQYGGQGFLLCTYNSFHREARHQNNITPKLTFLG